MIIIIFIIGFSCMCHIITTSLLMILQINYSVYNHMPAQENNAILWMLVCAVGVQCAVN